MLQVTNLNGAMAPQNCVFCQGRFGLANPQKPVPDRVRKLHHHLHLQPLCEEACAHRNFVDRKRKAYEKLAQEQAVRRPATGSQAVLYVQLVSKKKGRRQTGWQVGALWCYRDHY